MVSNGCPRSNSNSGLPHQSWPRSAPLASTRPQTRPAPCVFRQAAEEFELHILLCTASVRSPTGTAHSTQHSTQDSAQAALLTAAVSVDRSGLAAHQMPNGRNRCSCCDVAHTGPSSLTSELVAQTTQAAGTGRAATGFAHGV
jgi:hypothetical protein